MSSSPPFPTDDPSRSQSRSRSQPSTAARRPAARRTRRPSEFTLPDGTKVLVALPAEADGLRRRQHGAGGSPPPQTEVVVHGTERHAHLLRTARAHHARRADEIRSRVGAGVLDEWERVRGGLEEVERAERVLRRSEGEEGGGGGGGGGRLRENFEKFGFDARVRTFGDALEGGEGDGEGRGEEEDSETAGSEWSVRRGTTVKLFRRPVIKQYFHRGLLWRSSEETKVMSFELFFDLLYVGIIAINGDNAAEEANGHGLLRFVVTFIMSWKIWSDLQQFVSWFDSDDVAHRIEIVFLVACLLGLTTNTLQTFNEDYDTYSQLVGFFLAARLFLALHAAYIVFMLPLVRGMMVSQILLTLAAAALWIGSIHVPMPARLGLTFTALALELFGSAVHVGLFRYARSHSGAVAARLARFFDFYPAVNIEHKVERTNAFVTLVLGYSVVGVVFQNAGSGLNAFLGKAVLGLVQAFVFNWLYFEVDGGDDIGVHAVRRHVYTSFLWQHAHLAFIMAFILASAALSKLVVAADCPDSPAETLTEFYRARSEEEIPVGLRFYYCTGLAISLLSMGLIALSHEHKLSSTCRLPKWVRLANRFAVCVILFCLPAARRVNSLNLIAITTCLSVWVLLVELWGKSCQGDAFWGEDKARCYTAKCSKQALEEATKSDGEVDVVELGKSEKTGAVDVS